MFLNFLVWCVLPGTSDCKAWNVLCFRISCVSYGQCLVTEPTGGAQYKVGICLISSTIYKKLLCTTCRRMIFFFLLPF